MLVATNSSILITKTGDKYLAEVKEKKILKSLNHGNPGKYGNKVAMRYVFTKSY